MVTAAAGAAARIEVQAQKRSGRSRRSTQVGSAPLLRRRRLGIRPRLTPTPIHASRMAPTMIVSTRVFTARKLGRQGPTVKGFPGPSAAQDGRAVTSG